MIRAYVTEDLLGMAVRISLVQQAADDNNPALILRIDNDGPTPSYRWEPIDSAVETQPTLCLPQDAARALLDTLTRHFHGAEDTRALRKDYDAERSRADLMARALIDVSLTLATKATEVR